MTATRPAGLGPNQLQALRDSIPVFKDMEGRARAAHAERRQIEAIREEERREEIAANGQFGVGA